MDPTVYTKTSKGAEEIKTRAYQLSPQLRRVLILVDGRSTGGELADRLKTLGDIPALLNELSQGGFIAPAEGSVVVAAKPAVPASAVAPVPASVAKPVATAAAAPAVVSSPAAAAKKDELPLEEAKRRIRDQIYTLFGPMADPLVLKLEKCASYDSLRLHSEFCRKLVLENLGQRKADRFWTEVEPLLPPL